MATTWTSTKRNGKTYLIPLQAATMIMFYAKKIFDDFYHVGVGTVSTWLIPTSAGLIMIDSSQEPYIDHVLDNIRNLGFDPKDVKSQVRRIVGME